MLPACAYALNTQAGRSGAFQASITEGGPRRTKVAIADHICEPVRLDRVAIVTGSEGTARFGQGRESE
jgi:hypothetical protein